MTLWRSSRLTELYSKNLLSADQRAWHLTAVVEAAAMSNVGSKGRLGRVQLKNGELGSIRPGEANRGQHVFELLAGPAVIGRNRTSIADAPVTASDVVRAGRL
jgi:hypothetical protein